MQIQVDAMSANIHWYQQVTGFFYSCDTCSNVYCKKYNFFKHCNGRHLVKPEGKVVNEQAQSLCTVAVSLPGLGYVDATSFNGYNLCRFANQEGLEQLAFDLHLGANNLLGRERSARNKCHLGFLMAMAKCTMSSALAWF